MLTQKEIQDLIDEGYEIAGPTDEDLAELAGVENYTETDDYVIQE